MENIIEKNCLSVTVSCIVNINSQCQSYQLSSSERRDFIFRIMVEVDGVSVPVYMAKTHHDKNIDCIF